MNRAARDKRMTYSEALDIMIKGHQVGAETKVDPALSATYRKAVELVHGKICDESHKRQRLERHALSGPVGDQR